ncbi:CsiV family protein [Pseudomonas sp. Gutcm_11s]|uniref:CsiV family protein n=1 Tax=Pseudomonas sp. Gutcm_11s TaxID=3026088 RepID=UPI0023623B1E|nr:CsiV family protein [Pseudomonas sp. Gutcm_11s]MDD0843236.1 CsiV family protein [Pseudomonas sp. Gutcm_11s]
MRAFRPLFLLLCLMAPQAFADGVFQIELIVFRQGGEALSSSQPAPDDWAVGATPIAGNERGTALDGEAAKLNPGNGYEVLLHKAWAQNLSAVQDKAALSTGNEQFGHFPVEGVVTLSEQQRLVDLQADFWINRFDNDGLLTGSERVRQKTRLKLGELTYLDNGGLGVLVKVTQP